MREKQIERGRNVSSILVALRSIHTWLDVPAKSKLLMKIHPFHYRPPAQSLTHTHLPFALRFYKIFLPHRPSPHPPSFLCSLPSFARRPSACLVGHWDSDHSVISYHTIKPNYTPSFILLPVNKKISPSEARRGTRTVLCMTLFFYVQSVKALHSFRWGYAICLRKVIHTIHTISPQRFLYYSNSKK